MKCNIGKTDKIIRIVAGVVIGALGIYYQSWWGLVALLPLLTAAFSICGLYSLLGISTDKGVK
ncbi:MAG: DUF2892 domain-containing protein [Bacteroidales bacterium]|nr:DUF2892 domain-containing protein [Bacteroidales bacterium]MCF8458497.1 DUF2892 domain-containing protein [Bacteroidales bacterium]